MKIQLVRADFITQQNRHDESNSRLHQLIKQSLENSNFKFHANPSISTPVIPLRQVDMENLIVAFLN